MVKTNCVVLSQNVLYVSGHVSKCPPNSLVIPLSVLYMSGCVTKRHLSGSVIKYGQHV